MSVGKNMQACFMLYVHCMAELLYIDWRYEDMIKVIASDMDGTLLCDDHRIAPDTIAAVKEACAAGIRFMVATGRGYEGAMAELDGTGIVCDYILGSGAEVRDPQRKIVKECGIGMELCREICEEVKEFPISIVFLTNEGDYRIGTVVDGGDMFGRGAAFEPCGAQLPPSGIVAETDGEKGAAVYLVTDLAAECRGDRRDDAARGEITDQCRMPERSVGEDAERGDGGWTQDRQGTSGSWTFANTR